MKNIDPHIPLDIALAATNDNQAELGRQIGVSRQTISDWKREGLNLPPLYAHRFLKLFPHRLNRCSDGVVTGLPPDP